MDDNNLSSALTSDPETSGGAGPTDSISVSADAPATEATPNAPADNTLTPPDSPAPSAPGSADNLTGLHASLQPMIQAAGQATAQDMPRLSRLKASLAGFLLAGIPGAATGAIDPKAIQTEVNNRKQLAQADITFKNAQAAHEVTMAHIADREYQALPEKLQQESEARGQETLTHARQNGYVPVAQIPLDQGSDQNSQNAMTALNTVKSQFGGVPSGLLYIHTGDGMTVMKLQDPNAALDTINQARRAQGQSPIDSSVFQTLKPEDRDNMARDAINFSDPRDVNGMVTQASLNMANMRLATVKAQPDFNGKDALVTQLQGTVDHQKAVLDSGAGAEATRAGQAKGAEAQAAQPGTTAAGVADINAKAGPEAQAAAKKINATAGPEAAAAGAKAEAVAKGTALGQAEGGANEWKPKVTADEKKKAELAENIAFNANDVNTMLAQRPDLVGAIAGRFTNAKQMIGNNDKNISAIGNEIHNIAMANSGVHGFRSQEGVEETEKNILNHFKNGPDAVAGALKANTDSVQTFIDNARPPTYGTHSKAGGAVAYWQKQKAGGGGGGAAKPAANDPFAQFGGKAR